MENRQKGTSRESEVPFLGVYPDCLVSARHRAERKLHAPKVSSCFLTLRGRQSQSLCVRGLKFLYAFGFRPAVGFLNFKIDPITFGQCLEPLCFDG